MGSGAGGRGEFSFASYKEKVGKNFQKVGYFSYAYFLAQEVPLWTTSDGSGSL